MIVDWVRSESSNLKNKLSRTKTKTKRKTTISTKTLSFFCCETLARLRKLQFFTLGFVRKYGLNPHAPTQRGIGQRPDIVIIFPLLKFCVHSSFLFCEFFQNTVAAQRNLAILSFFLFYISLLLTFYFRILRCNSIYSSRHHGWSIIFLFCLFRYSHIPSPLFAFFITEQVPTPMFCCLGQSPSTWS